MADPAHKILQFPYRTALERQRELVRGRLAGEIPDLVWYLEHPPVVTWNPARGRRPLRAPESALRDRGVEIEETDRGGDITWHGPGLLVGYPIIRLEEGTAIGRDLHRYLRALEEALIAVLGRLGIRGGRAPGRTGVWVGAGKVAAIGIRSARWVTSHGFALNVCCDLGPFRDLIVPCGIEDAGVTSLAELLGPERAPRLEDLAPEVHRALEEAFDRPLAATRDGIRLLGMSEWMAT